MSVPADSQDPAHVCTSADGFSGYSWNDNSGVAHVLKGHVSPIFGLQISRDAEGVLGETFVPTKDADGKPIMTGMEAIRGQQEDCELSDGWC